MSDRSEVPADEGERRGGRLPNWWRRHAMLGLFLGLGLGTLGQSLVVGFGRGAISSTGLQSAVGVLYATAGWVVLSIGLALVSAAWLRSAWGRRLAVVLSVVVLSGVALTQAVGILLRVLSGTYLTAGAVLFALNSREHFLHAATGGYFRWILVALFFTLVLMAGLGRYLAGATHNRGRPARRQLAILLSCLIVVMAGYGLRGQFRFTRGMFVSGPLLALISSLDTELGFRGVGDGPETFAAVAAGPELATKDAWSLLAGSTEGPRPNILLIMLESVSPRHLNGTGGYRMVTPEIQRLAREGLQMTRAWTTATHSNYAQMAVLSSLFPRRKNTLDHYTRIDYPRTLFHDVFYELGYRTATISSQDENWQGMLRFQQTGTPTFYWYSANYRGEHFDTGTEKIVPDDVTTDVALEWLARHDERPWALYINYQGTHFPYHVSRQAPRPYQPDNPTWSTFTYLNYPESEREVVINRYDNALAFIDTQIGRLRQALERTGLLDDTLWIVTSDHGELFFERNLVTHGRTLFDVEARVPLILRWPKRLAPAVRDEAVSHLDLLPTTLALLELPPHPAFQGRNFATADAAGVGKRAIFLNIQGLRSADAIVCWPYKLILERTSQQQYLYDLERDPQEQQNRLDDLPEITERLAHRLTAQLRAQLAYHQEGAEAVRRTRYQPRLSSCPPLPKR